MAVVEPVTHSISAPFAPEHGGFPPPKAVNAAPHAYGVAFIIANRNVTPFVEIRVRMCGGGGKMGQNKK